MIKEKMKQLVGKSIKAYNNEYSKPKIDKLKFKEQYQGRIIDCMVGEVDDNYIETPLTDENVVKLEHSKEGVIKIPQIKGKTILIDADGNETDTPGEGCRLVSVGEEEDNKLIILSRNRNLFDGLPHTTSDGYSLNHLKDGVTYTIQGDNVTRIKIATYAHEPSGTENYLANADHKRLTFKYNNSKDWKMYIWVNGVMVDNYQLSNFQIEEGNVVTTYVEPKQHKTEILLDEPLRKLPNGVCDKIINNQLIRRIGKIVLNEKNNWKYSSTGGGEPYMYGVLTRLPIDCKTTLPADKGFFVTDTLPTKIHNHWSNSEIFGVHINPIGKSIYVNIPNEWLSNIDMNSFKEWIKKNPIEVLYELAEPIIEELPNSITLQGFDDATMYIENSITPTVSYGYNALIPYKQELSNQQEEVEVNTLDIENNIIPYLMDMEYNLMLMEDN